jgi:DNA modification methylase/superfamily II DNA or RNA helicase
MKYNEFIESKKVKNIATGFEPVSINEKLFDFQRDIVKWACKRGRAAIWADCGLGKTAMQLEWANQVKKYTGGKILIFAPLAVSKQTKREGDKFGYDVKICANMDDVIDGINITNYQKIENFDLSQFSGIVLDESSILKNYSGKYRNLIIDSTKDIPFRLACTATPAPNDQMELGNHSEYVGAMSRTEMLSMFFIHDGADTSKWRLKGHAEKDFYEWVCSWAVMIRKPSDLGYDDSRFILPELNVMQYVCDTDKTGDNLFQIEAKTLIERRNARRDTIEDRAVKAAEIIAMYPDEQWLIWTNLNTEADAIAKLSGAVNVQGSDSDEKKECAMMNFSAGEIKRLVSKPSIAGLGINWQQCHNVIFLGLSDSFEQYYQAIRRCWRFGQKKAVRCYIVTADIEGAVVENIERKQKDAEKMADYMLSFMKNINTKEIHGMDITKSDYKTRIEKSKSFELHLGDCCEHIKNIPDDSIDFTVFSPPFSSLYTYSNSTRDMGNSKDDDDFYRHFKFLVHELFRAMRPGRNVSFHCMNLPTSKTRDGYIGIKDFRGDMIRLFQECGFIYHSEVTIWKCPVVAMTRTHALGLLHSQLKKDSAMSRQGIPDYLVTMRKPGENAKPINGELEHFAGDMETFTPTGNLSIDIWQKYASPVWMDINPSNTLQYMCAKQENDERHICPLQLDVIERALQLWSLPGDLVYSPFTGIGSEGYMALKLKRLFLGTELKESYFNIALNNLKEIESSMEEVDLFANVN